MDHTAVNGHPPARARYFSLDDAERTIPLVRRIVSDIRDEYRELQTPLHRMREIGGDAAAPAALRAGAASAAVAAAQDEELERLRRDLDRRSARLNGYLGELLELGCHFKDFDLGLVDFFSRLDGRPVHLCWKLGEPAIEYWHEIDAGFAGRRPIPVDERDRFQGE